MHILKNTSLGLSACLLLLSQPTTAKADDADDNLGLEEIVVTAQKREESLSDVPISIVALSGQELSSMNIYKMEDLQYKVPNLQINETGVNTQIFIRGIGTGTNQGFEQSVGMYVDGVYYGRAQLIRQPIFDMQRVEVLRGPQGILFGKNSIAGAISYTTAKPTGEFDSYARADYDWDHNATLFEAMVNGGNDTFAGRLTVRKYDDDGWIKNVTSGKHEPRRDDFAIRGQLLWNPSDDLDMTLKYEHQEFDTKGRQVEIIEDGPAIAGPFTGATYTQILGLLGYPDAIVDAKLNNIRSVDGTDFSDNKVNNATFTLNYAWGDNTLTAISSYMDYEYSERCQCDFTSAPIFYSDLYEKYSQFSQEIRLVSPGGETIDWLAGVFYQGGDIDYSDIIPIPGNSILGLLSPALQVVLNTGPARTFTQDSDLFAAFAQAKWNISDNWAMTFGGRWTTETKKAAKELNIVNTITGENMPDFPDSASSAVWQGAFKVYSEQFMGHAAAGERTESKFLPMVRAEWRPNDASMYYASYTNGYKAGGFDVRSNNDFSFEFENEDADSYEIGGKFSYWDGRAETNIAIYRTDYDNLQIGQYDGVLGFNVGNVKETRVQGVEIDGRMLLTDGLTWSYALAYLDFEYKDFENANCYARETPTGDVVDGVQMCSRTGGVGQYAPEWTAYTSLDWVTPINSDWDFRIKGDLSYSDEQNVHSNLDPKYGIDSFIMMDLRLAVSNNNWDIAILGKNITDENFLSYVANVPLSSGTFGTNSFYGFNTRERSWWLQVAWRY